MQNIIYHISTSRRSQIWEKDGTALIDSLSVKRVRWIIWHDNVISLLIADNEGPKWPWRQVSVNWGFFFLFCFKRRTTNGKVMYFFRIWKGYGEFYPTHDHCQVDSPTQSIELETTIFFLYIGEPQSAPLPVGGFSVHSFEIHFHIHFHIIG